MEPQDVKDPITVSGEGEGAIVTDPNPDPKPGEKTDPTLLLESLQEEREKRRLAESEKAELEQELLDLKNNPGIIDHSDEGAALQEQINSLNEKIAIGELVEKHPVLKEHTADFQEFRKKYPGVELDAAAKLYISEKDLAPAVTPRPGLEKTSGGQRSAPQSGMSMEEITTLRQTNYRKYAQMVKDGKIVIPS